MSEDTHTNMGHDTLAPGAAPPASARIELALISHTNAGKTSLARTLLGKDIGEVRDAPHVTELAEPHTLLATREGDELRLWDTPGFGDSARLIKRLRVADNPIGWLLREVWDKYRDRPFWCSQQAVRAARDSADVVLYLVNTAEDPRDAGYVAPEMQVLRWVGRPIIVLLNQTGPPRPQAEEAAERERWREHLAPLGDIGDVLALDAFARCWVQEAVLLDAVARSLPATKHAALARLRAEWTQQHRARFDAAMRTLARHVAAAARDREPLHGPDAQKDDSGWQKLLRAVGVNHAETDAAREHAMAQLAQRLDVASRAATDELIALHGLHGSAAQLVLERLRQNYDAREPVNETRGALLGSALTGALTGLKADLAAGGLTMGAGLLIGGVVGGLAGAGAARGINALRGEPDVRWSDAFLDGLVRSSVLRYLAVAHFGRGRGRWVEGEAPAFWQAEVEAVVQAESERWHALWPQLRDPHGAEATAAVSEALRATCAAVLGRLYPAATPLLTQRP
ncbi:MAG: DUF3482 domain-containing protein [Burkholderiales bacterium]|jgi:hypothetical protein|nr:DUF3482 domain-containing protein [Burkholderiales bacterium]